MPTLKPLGQAPARRAVLSILATTDLHLNGAHYNYEKDAVGVGFSFEQLIPLIVERRAQVENSLLLDNGDFLQGTPLAQMLLDDWVSGVRHHHPLMQAMSALGYDAGTLGNHEFNFGLDYLCDVLGSASFPMVCANIVNRFGTDPTKDHLAFLPYTILDRDLQLADGGTAACRIGIIGFLPPQVMQWDRAHLEGKVQARQILEAARSWVPKLKQEGADLIIALGHCGISEHDGTVSAENAGHALARVPDIDALILGHTHLIFPDPQMSPRVGIDPVLGKIEGKPAVQPGFGGACLGEIKLELDVTSQGWRVTGSRAELHHLPHNGVPDRTAEIAMAKDALYSQHNATLAYIRRPLGETKTRLDTFLALVGPSTALRYVATCVETTLKTGVQSGAYPDLPIVAVVTPFKVGGWAGAGNFTDVPAGPVLQRHISDLYTYPNRFAVICQTGAQLRQWLEDAAALYPLVTIGRNNGRLFDGQVPAYEYDILSGLTYEIDMSKPTGYGSGRIRNVMFKGRPVADDMRFLVGTSDYRVEARRAQLKNGDVLLPGGDSVGKILHDYTLGLKHPIHISAVEAAAPFRFAKFDQPTQVTVLTSPEARENVEGLDGMKALGMTESGFLEVALDLTQR